MKYRREQDFLSLSERESSLYGLLNSKCLMTNHATFDTQLEHVSASRVHAWMQATVELCESYILAHLEYCSPLLLEINKTVINKNS